MPGFSKCQNEKKLILSTFEVCPSLLSIPLKLLSVCLSVSKHAHTHIHHPHHFCEHYLHNQTFTTIGNNGATLPVSQLEQGDAWVPLKF